MIKKSELCILHIGTEKTGSTTIQENFHKTVSDPRANYPDLGGVNHNVHLFGLFLKNPHKLYYFVNNNFSEIEIENFRKETKTKLEKYFLDPDKSITILSAEALATSTLAEIQEMKAYLSTFFQKVLVIVYIRPTQSFCNSAFQQRVKYHNLSTIEFNLVLRNKNIDNYIKVYGADSVKIIPFLPFRFPQNDIMIDFCRQSGLKEQISSIKQSNESLSKEAVSILFTYNYHQNVHSDFKNQNFQIQNILVEKIRAIGTEKFLLSGKLVANWVTTHFEDDYHWTLNQVLPEERKYFTIDTSIQGISTSMELMMYATQYIDELVTLIGTPEIPFVLEKTPQTVAKLVDFLKKQIQSELK